MYRVNANLSGVTCQSPVEFRHHWDAQGVVAKLRQHGVQAWVEQTSIEAAVDGLLIQVAMRVLQRAPFMPAALRKAIENFLWFHGIQGVI
jgi:hypothetical protein